MRNENIKISGPERLAAFDRDILSISGDYFAAARHLQTAVWVYDIDNSCVLHANAAACHLWQARDEEDLRNRDLASDMSSTVSKRLRQYQTDFLERDATFKEMWTLYPMGQPTSVMVIFHGFRLPDGRMAMLCEVVGRPDDESDTLRSAEALLHTDVMISLYEMDGPPLYMNPAARNTTTNAAESIAEKFIDASAYHTLLFELENTGEHRMVTQMKTVTGQRWYDLSAKQCSDAVTGKPAILVTAVDVSELKIARDKARYLADRDQLTGCYNRAYLLQHMAMLTQYQSQRCALLYFDVDHFKQINDRYGHEMGDAVLKEIASRIQGAIRESDIIVRQGGDEFVILLEDIPTGLDFTRQINRLVEVLSKPITQEATRINVHISMGVTTFLPSEADFTVVMREADIALYASKQAGRNRVTFFNEAMGDAAKARDLIEIELKRAVANREFVLHYQPRVNLRTGRVVSAEALVRWDHPQRGLITPGEFIPVCEETGMIEDLGQLVLEMGCKQAMAWHRAGIDIELSINISPRQFGDKRLLRALETYAQHPDFPAGKIELEITEGVLIGDHGMIERKLDAISAMGYGIAIDDFGTGYSNLSYISRFPLNCLKIDQSFISQLPKSGPIIRLILTLAKQIGATAVAEGVETQEQFDWLCEHDCDQAQGYLLSRPVKVEKFGAVMGRLNAT